MRARLLTVTAALALLASGAVAQTPPPPADAGMPQPEMDAGGPPIDPAGGPGGPEAETPPPPPPPGADEARGPEREGRNKPHHMAGEGPSGERGPHGPHGPRGMHMREAGTGFTLKMGRHDALRVSCGDEEIAACIEAAQPLIDALSGNNDRDDRD